MISRTVIITAVAEIGRYLELLGENKFKVAAYQKAARSLDQVSEDLEKLVEQGRLTSVPNVGKGIAPVIEEIVRTGQSSYLEELRKQFPPGVLELMRVPNLGVKKIRALYEELGIGSIAELKKACDEGALTKVPGFGAKTAATLCESLAKALEQPERFLLHDTLPLAEQLREAVASIEGVVRADVAGSIRRRLETVGDIDIVFAAKAPERVLADLSSDARFAEGTIDGRTWQGRISEVPVEIFGTTPDHYAAELVRTTGSEQWLESIGFREKRVAADDETADRAWFAATKTTWREPEMREEAVADVKQPRSLIRFDHLTGTFHSHSTWSDGKHTLDQMVEAAAAMGLTYLGLSDHSRSAAYAGGLTVERLRLQHAEIESVARKYPVRLFRGSEVDILSDGGLDYDPETLAELDFTIASVHSRFSMDRDQMTERIVNALRNPFTTFLGHLSGRKLLVRDPYDIDYRAIFDAAAENGVIVEINGNPYRLDVDWRWLQEGLDRGVSFSINPDAHSMAALGHLLNGVWNARKGGIPKDRVFNTRPLEEVTEYLEKRRARAIESVSGKSTGGRRNRS